MGKTRESGELVSNNLLSADHSSQTVNVGSAITFYGGTTGIISATSFSGSGANLTNLPSDIPADTDVQITYDISANGSSAYRITGPGYSAADDNPDLYLVRGQRYRFINTTGSGHPFRIQSNTSGTAYTDGVTGSESGTQDFNVQYDAPARLYYQCTSHGGMIGNIYIVGGSDWRMTEVTTAQTPEIYTNLNVGIGTNDPNMSLHVLSSSDDVARFQSTSGGNGPAITLDHIGGSPADNDTIGKIVFNAEDDGGGNSITYADIKVISTDVTDTSEDAAITFNTRNAGGFSEKLRITSAGLVGIGTDDPQAKLHVSDGANGLEFNPNSQNAVVSYNRITSAYAPVGLQGSTVALRIGGVGTALKVESNGRVAIGTDSPSDVDHTLCVAGTDNTTSLTGGHNQGIQLQNKSTTDGTYSQIEWRTSSGGRYARIAGIQDDANGNGGQLAFLTENTSGSTVEALRIASDGKIGINNSAPLYAMHFKNAMASTPSFIHMEVTGTNAVGGGGGIAFDTSASNSDSNNTLYLATIAGIRNSSDDGSNDLVFSTSKAGVNSHLPTEKLRITSGGSVGIGTPNPGAKLQIRTTNEAALDIIDSSLGNNAPYIRVLGIRTGTNPEQSFTGQLFLASLRSDQKIASGKKLGTVLFGGNHTDATEGNILYAASIAGVAGDDFDSATDMPTDLVFYTGSTGRAPAVANVSSGTERLRITSDGSVGIGTDGPLRQLDIFSAGHATAALKGNTQSSLFFVDNDDSNIGQISYMHADNYMYFRVNDAERVRIHSTGYVNWGNHQSTDQHRINGVDDTQGDAVLTVSAYQGSNGTTQDTAIFFGVNASGTPNSSAAAIKVFRHNTTLRSLNCAGTVNTGGNDYAEYMTKAGDFTIAKGDICGINTQGKLTNVFADAVTFIVKSTDPSYVGGDTWDIAAGEEPGGYDDTRTGEELEAAKVAYQEQLEIVRQTVDRIAFSGQTPVNVTGSTPGQYIIPTANSDGSILGIAKSEGDLTLAEYMSSIGKVIAIEDDGRARIIVKVA